MANINQCLLYNLFLNSHILFKITKQKYHRIILFTKLSYPKLPQTENTIYLSMFPVNLKGWYPVYFVLLRFYMVFYKCLIYSPYKDENCYYLILSTWTFSPNIYLNLGILKLKKTTSSTNLSRTTIVYLLVASVVSSVISSPADVIP